jgi:hypothetical protein
MKLLKDKLFWAIVVIVYFLLVYFLFFYNPFGRFVLLAPTVFALLLILKASGNEIRKQLKIILFVISEIVLVLSSLFILFALAIQCFESCPSNFYYTPDEMTIVSYLFLLVNFISFVFGIYSWNKYLKIRV